MANMSYCRFENTTGDMVDCINAIEDNECNDLSDYEVRALRDFLDLAKDIVQLEDEINNILEEYGN